jgi:4-hydroxybenzoate polyprenyltransferase
VLLWTAGFDIIYACQDFQADREMGLFSVPAKLGIARALWVSRITHAACVGVLIALGLIVPQFIFFYWIAVALAAVLLTVEQSLVRPNDLSKLSLAFFTVNGAISCMIGILGIADILRH